MTAVVLGGLLLLLGLGLLAVAALGWRGALPRNRWAGVRTPASLRSDAAFAAANRVAAPPVAAGGFVAALCGAVALGADGAVLVVLLVGGLVGALVLAAAGGVLGDRAAAAVRPGPAPAPSSAGCAGCAGGCDALPRGASGPAGAPGATA